MAAETAELTRRLGGLVAASRAADLSEAAIAGATTGFCDTIGTMIAGASAPSVAILRQLEGAETGPDGASLLPDLRRERAPTAALINGTAAHVLDFDDVGPGLRGHPSTVLVPAILAEAEELGASGEEMLLAYCVGYQVWWDLVRRDRGHHHVKGWHPTSVFGAPAAAAACARLRRLGPEQTTHALAIAVSMSGGVMSNFGSDVKSMHAGLAAQAGVRSARLAAHGFHASPDAIEHRSGFLSAISPGGEIDRHSAPEWGPDWKIAEGVSVKRYPVCYFGHRSIDSMLGLLEQTPVAADAVETITVRLSNLHADMLRNHAPASGLEAKFSLQFDMAACLVAGEVTLAQLEDDFVTRPEVQALFPRVVVDRVAEENPALPGYAYYDQVSLTLRDGRTLDGPRVKLALGHAHNPMPEAELRRKFVGNLRAGGVGEPRANALFAALCGLGQAEQGVAAIRAALGG